MVICAPNKFRAWKPVKVVKDQSAIGEYNVVIKHKAKKIKCGTQHIVSKTIVIYRMSEIYKSLLFIVFSIKDNGNLIKEQKENEEFGNLYSYLENSEMALSANMHILQK